MTSDMPRAAVNEPVPDLLLWMPLMAPNLMHAGIGGGSYGAAGDQQQSHPQHGAGGRGMMVALPFEQQQQQQHWGGAGGQQVAFSGPGNAAFAPPLGQQAADPSHPHPLAMEQLPLHLQLHPQQPQMHLQQQQQLPYQPLQQPQKPQPSWVSPGMLDSAPDSLLRPSLA